MNYDNQNFVFDLFNISNIFALSADSESSFFVWDAWGLITRMSSISWVDTTLRDQCG